MAPSLLRDSCELVRDFVLSQLSDSGGFLDRGGDVDLYYTVFGVDCLLALQEELPRDRIDEHLSSLGEGEDLDFVHRGCLARALASAGIDPGRDARERIAARIETHRSKDGGYHNEPGREFGTAYGCFLATAAYQDLGLELPNPDGVVRSFEALRTKDGGYSNERGAPVGMTTATAAAVAVGRQLGQSAPDGVAEWIRARFHESGGFFALPGAPMPDLLSTATALHTLSGLECDIEPFRELGLDYLDSLWTNKGAFHGHWADEYLDCEYTWYGLLTLGHLGL